MRIENGNLNVNGTTKINQLFDYVNSSGITGQVLTSVPSGIQWTNLDVVITGSTTGKLNISDFSSFTANTLPNTYFKQSGNTFGVTAILGTNDSQGLNIITSGQSRIFVTNIGNVGIGTSTPTSTLEVSGTINGLLISRGNGNVATNISIGATTNFSSSATGLHNFAAGNLALSNLTTGEGNTAIGQSALLNNTTGNNNISIGRYSSLNNTTGYNNTALGRNSLRFNTTGNHNTAIGYYSLYSNTTGVNNTALSPFGLRSNTTGENNTAIGRASLFFNTTGNRNTAIGSSALYRNIIGNDNTAIGLASLLYNTSGSSNTALGLNTLYSNTSGNNNTAIGFQSLRSNTTGASNAAIGRQALLNNTTGIHNTAIGNYSLYSNTTGGHNTAIGRSSLVANTTGGYNTAIGRGSLFANTSGQFNTAIGRSALNSNTTGGYNTAIGLNSLFSNTTGNFNTSIGRYSLQYNTTGTYNTAIGVDTLRNNTTGSNNTAIGRGALRANTTGANNTAIGFYSLRFNTTGIHNTAIGRASLYYNTTGIRNTAIGYVALRSNTTGNHNTAIGYASLFYNTTGSSNTAIGRLALHSNTTGTNNIAIGYNSLNDNTTGIHNTALGALTLGNNTTGNRNTAIGQYSLLYNTTGNNNTAIGSSALRFNTTGTYNTAIGNAALRGNTTGTYNTAIGLAALQSNTTGSHNTAIGLNSLLNNTTGTDNTVIGRLSLRYNTTGINNTAIGRQSLTNNTTGDNNTAIGFATLYGNTTGYGNNAIGRYSLRYNTTGAYNTSIGGSALRYNTTGANNIAFGLSAGRLIADGSTANTITNASIFIGRNTRALANNQTNQIVIGDSAIGLGSNTVVLGDANITTTALRGNVGIGTTSPSAPLMFGKSVYGDPSSEDFFRIKFEDFGGIHNDVGIGQPAFASLGFNSGGAGYTSFNEGTNGERMRIANGGNVGIGTTTPNAALHISGSGIVNIVQSSNSVSYTQYYNSSTGGNTTNDGLTVGLNGLDAYVFLREAANLLLGTSDTEHLRITSTGNIGIGTTTPAYKLHVVGEIYASSNLFGSIVYSNTYRDQSGGVIALQDDAGSVGIGTGSPTSKLDVFDGDISVTTANVFSFFNNNRNFIPNSSGVSLGGMRFRGYSTGTTYQVGSQILSYSSNGWNSTSTPGYLSFQTTPSGSTTPTEKMVITSNGDVGIGTTNPVQKLQVGDNSVAALGLRIAATGVNWDMLTNSSGHLSIANGSGDYLTFNKTTNASYFNLGDVGIGTTTPSQKLDINGALVVGMTTPAPFWNAKFKDYNDGSGIYISAINGGGGKYIAGNSYYYNSTQWWSDKTVASAINLDNGTLVFYTDSGLTPNTDYIPSERMRINSTGNLLVGTTSNLARLHVRGAGATSSTTGFRVEDSNGISSLIVRDDRRIGVGIDNPSAQFHISGTSLSNPLLINTSGGTVALSVNNLGNVGIGTTNPNSILEISQATPILRIESSDVNQFHGIEFRNGTNLDSFIKQLPQSGEFKISNGRSIGWGGHITFYTDTVEHLRITAAGNVGIGTTSPSAKLQVRGAGATSSTTALRIENSSATPSMVVLDNGSVGIGTTSPTGPLFVTSISPNPTNPYVIIEGYAAGGYPMLRFNQTNNPGNAPFIEGYYTNGGTLSFRVRDTGEGYFAGNVGIGTTTPAFTLDVNGTARATTLLETSSERYKTNIIPLPSQLDTINKLNPVTFNWKDETKGNGTQYGLIAEEVLNIIPDAVETNDDGTAEAISYTKLVPILIKAVQELQKEVNELKEKLNK